MRRRAVGAPGTQIRQARRSAASSVRSTFESRALRARYTSRSNMPPAPIDGSCAPSPIATSFDPCASRPQSADLAGRCQPPRLVDIDGRVLVDAQPPALTPETRASSVSVCPPSARLSWPGRCAVDPGHRDPERVVAGEPLGLLGGVDHDTLAGASRPDETRTAPGPVMTARAWASSSNRRAPIRSGIRSSASSRA
jgi:hypothetical protein